MKACRFPQFFTLALLAFVAFGFAVAPQVWAEQFAYQLDTNPGWTTEGVLTRDEPAVGNLQAYSQELKASPVRRNYSAFETISDELFLTTLFASDNGSSGNMFDLQVNEVLTITRFQINISSPGSINTIEIYYRVGTCFGHESSPDGWILLGTDSNVVSSGTNIPTPVDIGGLTLEPGQVYGFYVNLASYPSSVMEYTNGGPTVFSNARMSLTTNCGKSSPAFIGSTFFPRQWNGTIYYTIGSPDDLGVAPAEGLASSGNQGGPFTPASKNYTLTNNGPNSLDWTAAATMPWIDLDTSNGTLAPGDSVMTAVSFNVNADSLSPGDYNDTVTFTNINSGISQMRNVQLTVNAPPPPPSQPTNPNPADGATLVDVNTLLQWNTGGSSTLQNGGFETGDFSGWTIVTGPGTEFQPWTLATAGSGIWFANGMPFEGTYFAQNGFDGGAGLFYDIYQEIAIPSGATSAQLEWSERLQWDTTYGATIARPYDVTLRSTGGGTLLATLFSTTLPPNTTGDTGYVTHSVDLIAAAPGIAGQTVRINYHQSIPETYTGPAQFDLDGVSLTTIGGTSLKRVELGPSPYRATSTLAGTKPSLYPRSFVSLDRAAYLKIKAEAARTKVTAGTNSYTPVDAKQDSQLSYKAANTITNVAIFQNSNPWGNDKNQQVLIANGISYTIYNSSAMGAVDLSIYDKVIIASVQNSAFYTALGANIGWFESYVAAGGILDIHIATYGDQPLIPGGFRIVPRSSNAISIVDSHHPVVTTPHIITDAELDDWNSSVHGYISVVPAGAHEILKVTDSNLPCAMELNFGLGRIFVTTQTVEWSNASYNYLENTILYGASSVTAVTYDVYFDTTNPPMTLIHSGLTVPSCEPLPYPLDYETTYYWQVVASNSSGQTVGPIWSFTTIGPPGEIEVTDSIAPPNDLNMPFGPVITGLSRTEQITITNTDPTYGLIITDISLGGRYFEDFNDGLAQDWHEDIDQNWQVIAGEYRAQSSASDFMMAHYEAKQWDNLSVQMTCRRTGNTGNSVAVTLRGTSDFDEYIGSGYVFQIAISGDYSIWKQVNGSWSWLQPWTNSPSITTGNNTLTAVAEGSLLKFFINGTLVWTGSDSAFVSGHIGLAGYTSSGDTTHYFDNVLVGKPMTSVQIISDEQLWYNQHSYDGGEPQAAPKDWVPPPYPNKNKFQQQPAQKTSTLSSDEAFRLENLPSLPLVIPPLGNVTFDVVFEPNSTEDYESSVVIKSNDADESEVIVQLNGTGVLDYLQIVPQQDFEFSGHPGGPFLPSNTYYYLTNNGVVNINWTVAGPDWLNISSLGGIIKPGETTKVTVAPNALARSKGEGIYLGILLFTDITTAVPQTRNVTLNISTEPKVWINPYSFDVNVCTGSSKSENLAIGNGGDGLLNFILRGKQIGFTPASMPPVAAYNLMVETKKDIAAMAPAKHSFTATAKNTAFAKGKMLVRFAPQMQINSGGSNRTWPSLAAKNSILTEADNGKLAAAHVTKEYTIVSGLSLVKLPDNIAVEDALVTLNNTPGILYAEPDYQVKALSAGQTIPNDPRFSDLWGLNNTGQSGGTPDADIDAPEAWNIATGSSNIIVAVIDTGVDYTHPDLAANMWVNAAEANGIPGVDDDGNGYIDDIHGYDFVNNDGDPMDDHYHGTHCAGTIGAVGNNGQGVAGVCWNVKIMALKFLDSSGSGNTSDAIEAVQYAILMGANLSSNSWGGGSYSQALKDVIDAAGNANQLFVAAAGNSSSDNDISPAYPASYTSENIIAVLATDRYDNMSSFSSYGLTSVDIGAPGSDILSCQPGSNYQYLSGTSMATPHVSGATALIWSFSPSMPYQEVKDLLIQTADKIPALAGRCVSEGRLNLYNAVNELGVPWFEFVPQSGSVRPGEVNNVSVLFYGDVPIGTYQGQITVSTNDPYTPEVNIPVTMTVEPLDYFTELFDSGDNDMANRTLTFMPNGSVYYYNLCTAPASEFPVDPAGGTIVTLHDDDYYEVQLQGNTINLYGTSYDTFYIGSNGYITFASGDTHYLEQFTEHFTLPRIAALFDDLNPSASGTISYKELPDRVVVTFQNIPEFSQTTTNSFQVEMFFYDKIRITFLNIAAVDGLTGLSQGNGIPVHFSESNLSEYGLCKPPVGGDFDTDGNIDWFDLLIFVNNWLRSDCDVLDWCEGTDLDKSGSVNFTDFVEFTDYWSKGI